jgi:hypothetical protein
MLKRCVDHTSCHDNHHQHESHDVDVHCTIAADCGSRTGSHPLTRRQYGVNLRVNLFTIHTDSRPLTRQHGVNLRVNSFMIGTN